MIQIKDIHMCTACMTCVIACSYHHSKTFSHSLASVKVSRNFQTGDVRIEFEPTCDTCAGEALPLCIEFCQRNVLTVE